MKSETNHEGTPWKWEGGKGVSYLQKNELVGNVGTEQEFPGSHSHSFDEEMVG